MKYFKRRPSGNCPMCGKWRRSLHQDHIVQKWEGGKNEASNYQYVCANCHEDKTWEEHQKPEFKAYMRECARLRRPVTDEGRAMYRAIAQERAKSPEYRAKLSRGLMGRKYSQETKEKLRGKALERMKDPAKRLQSSLGARAAWAKPEHREKMLKAFSKRPPPPGRPHTEAAKQKMREYAKNRPPMSAETKNRIAVALRAFRQRKGIAA